MGGIFLFRVIFGFVGSVIIGCLCGFKKPFREIYLEPDGGGKARFGALVIIGLWLTIKVFLFGFDSIIYKPNNSRTKNLKNKDMQEFMTVDTLNLEDSTKPYNVNRNPVNDTKRLELDSLLKKHILH